MNRAAELAVAALAATAFASSARAADWLQNIVQPEPVANISEPVELGTGWYLRGDAGAGFDSVPGIAPKPSLSGWSIDLGAGYQVNQWLRFDVGLNMRKPQNYSYQTQTINGQQIICPSGSAGGNNALQTLGSGSNGVTITELNGTQDPYAANQQIGYVWDPILGTCHQNTSTSLNTMALLLNGYVDLGTWAGFTPYVGAGAGVARLASSASVNYYNNATGTLYAPTAGQWQETTGTPLVWVNANGQMLNVGQGGGAYPPVDPNTGKLIAISTAPNWNIKQNSTRYNFAWALMAGVAYSLSPHAKLDVGFRYLNMGANQYFPGGPSSQVTAKEVKVGLRYMID